MTTWTPTTRTERRPYLLRLITVGADEPFNLMPTDEVLEVDYDPETQLFYAIVLAPAPQNADRA